MKISEILKALRTDAGLTQKQLSDILKIGQATIACYESGQREPHIESLIAYANYFECSIDYLAGRCDDFGNVIVSAEKSKNSVNALSQNERDLIEKYRKLSSVDKIKLSGYIAGLTDK